MKYYIADLHNYDPNIIVYESRPFKSLEEMRDTLIRNWNGCVSSEDEVFLLGDIGDYEILGFLNGKITVVAGNHDDIDGIRNAYPSIEVSRYPIMVGNTILSHEPVGYMPESIPYLNIHGHIHSFFYGVPGNWNDGNRYFCVSAEQIGYTPISEDEIIKMIGYTQQLRRVDCIQHQV